MTKTNKTLQIKNKLSGFSLGALLFSLYFSFPGRVWAAINNPAIDSALGGDGTEEGATAASEGGIFAEYFVFLWKAFINVGGVAVLVYFLWGAFEWITAGGDSGKLGNARNRMLHAAIGLIILVSSFTILGFISSLFFGESFNLLELTFTTSDGPSGLKKNSKVP